jgi:hypothetical protein
LNCNEEHSELGSIASGLCINPKYPNLGATPGGVVKCKCCGKGLLEIKCPKDRYPHDVTDGKYCLQPNKGEMQSHEYYYQVQGQMAVYCDFVCWTPKGIHIERILPDLVLFSQVIKPALDNFFVRILLPLLLTGKVMPPDQFTGPSKSSGIETYCFCDGEDERWLSATTKFACESGFILNVLGLSASPVDSGTALLNVGLQISVLNS